MKISSEATTRTYHNITRPHGSGIINQTGWSCGLTCDLSKSPWDTMRDIGRGVAEGIYCHSNLCLHWACGRFNTTGSWWCYILSKDAAAWKTSTCVADILNIPTKSTTWCSPLTPPSSDQNPISLAILLVKLTYLATLFNFQLTASTLRVAANYEVSEIEF